AHDSAREEGVAHALDRLHDALIEIVQARKITPQSGRHVAEAHDRQLDRRESLEIGRGVDTCGQMRREGNVARDERRDAATPEVLEDHPQLERAEAERLRRTILGEPWQPTEA